jgi:glycosyltransferase involved in cell wall biosynthesis
MVEINTRKFTVSVIIAVYNRPQKLQRALRSLYKQTFKNYEVIVIDDGSSKPLCNILETYYTKFKSLKYIRHSNRKTPLSLNAGIRIASGKYFTFLDSDDEYMPGHLAARVRYMKNNSNVDIIHSNAKIIGKKEDFYVPDARNSNKLIHLNECTIGATIFAKKELFDILEGFKNFYGYDYDFVKRAARKKMKVAKIKSSTYVYYRNSDDSIINLLKENNFETKK